MHQSSGTTKRMSVTNNGDTVGRETSTEYRALSVDNDITFAQLQTDNIWIRYTIKSTIIPRHIYQECFNIDSGKQQTQHLLY